MVCYLVPALGLPKLVHSQYWVASGRVSGVKPVPDNLWIIPLWRPLMGTAEGERERECMVARCRLNYSSITEKEFSVHLDHK